MHTIQYRDHVNNRILNICMYLKFWMAAHFYSKQLLLIRQEKLKKTCKKDNVKEKHSLLSYS